VFSVLDESESAFSRFYINTQFLFIFSEIQCHNGLLEQV